MLSHTLLLFLMAANIGYTESSGSPVKPWKMMKKQLDTNIVELKGTFDRLMESCMKTGPDSVTVKEALATTEKLLALLKNQTGECSKNQPTADLVEEPCSHKLSVRFDTWWDEREGDKWYNISLSTNTSKVLCSRTKTWVQPVLFDDEGKRSDSDYEQILALCPPSPECVPHVTRSYTYDDWPQMNQQGTVSLITNYASNCSIYNGHTLDLEVKSCPTSRQPDNEIFRLPESCLTDICTIPAHGTDSKKMEKLGLQVVG